MTTVEAELDQRTSGASLIIWLVGATVVLFLVWARFAALDEIVRSDGQVVSSSRPQIIQNLEGGILSELMVSEGDRIEEGAVLAQLRGTQFATRVQDLEAQLIAADIRRLRLAAETEGLFDFDVPQPYIDRAPAVVASQRSLLNARQSDYVSRTEGAQRVMVETERELAVMEDLLARDIVATIEVSEARKSHADAENRYNEIVTTSELERASDYSLVLQEVSSLTQELRLAKDQLSRTVIRSPMKGIVNSISVSTIGGVVRPGEEIFQITPLDDELFVEARVKPQDIANVVAGQMATVKLTAYDYTIYGSLSGEVMTVSADTFEDERARDGESHYRVTVAVDLEDLSDRQHAIEIRPGMQANVELHTGEKTVLDYLTKPLYRSREALREP